MQANLRCNVLGSSSRCESTRRRVCQLLQVIATKSQCALRQPISRSGANCPSPADNHIFDGLRRFAESGHPNNFEFVRKKPLFDEPDSIVLSVEGHRPIMPGLAADSDV